MSATKKDQSLKPLSPLRQSPRLVASPRKTLRIPDIHPLDQKPQGENDKDDEEDDADTQDEFTFDFTGMYTSSPSKRAAATKAFDNKSVDDSFVGPRRADDVSFWDLQNSSHDKPDKDAEGDEPFGPVVKPNSRKETAPHETFRRPGLFRSLSHLMSRGGGGGGGGGTKFKKFSAASLGAASGNSSGQDSKMGIRANSHGKAPPSVLPKVPNLLGEDSLEDGGADTENGRRHTPSRTSSLTFRRNRQQGKNMGLIGRHNSSASLPEIPMITTNQQQSDMNALRSERNCVVLDIQRKPTGDPDETTEGYRIVHLITDLIEMTVWDAVREAHRSYSDNRIFKVDKSLEHALQNGSKRGILVVGGCNTEKDQIEIRQSFDYWKTKDFKLTLEALLPVDKQRLSIQVEYADVVRAVDGEKDMFDRL